MLLLSEMYKLFSTVSITIVPRARPLMTTIVFRVATVVFRVATVVFRVATVVFRVETVVFRVETVVFKVVKSMAWISDVDLISK
jgi:hypothetical protein